MMLIKVEGEEREKQWLANTIAEDDNKFKEWNVANDAGGLSRKSARVDAG